MVKSNKSLVFYKKKSVDLYLAAYSNIRSALKTFFEKFELSLQRFSLRLDQAKCILQVFEHFMFIYSINLAGKIFRNKEKTFLFVILSIENNLTDGIFEQLSKLSLDHLKSLNLSKNKLTSNGIRKLFEEKSMVKFNFSNFERILSSFVLYQNNLLLLDLTGNSDIDCVTITFIRTRHPNLTVHQ